ncbi:MAG: hypothetical protein ACKO2N_05975, partial [Tabrizicola sp.]
MTKEIFTLIAGLVLGFIATNGAWLAPELNTPADLFGIFFLVVLALVSFAEDKDADAHRMSTWLKRRDGPMIYTRVVQGLMRALDRLLMPTTAEEEPIPARGFWSRWDWLTTPRARDAADLARLRKNPWSWPVYDAALKLAVFYPTFLALAQWTWSGYATGLPALVLFPYEDRTWLRAAIISLILVGLFSRLYLATTFHQKLEKSAARFYLASCSALA